MYCNTVVSPILQVVCRQLGFPGDEAQTYDYSPFGRGNSFIMFTRLRCTGSEVYITDCPNNGVNFQRYCNWGVATVRCVGKYIKTCDSCHFSRSCLVWVTNPCLQMCYEAQTV